MFNLHSPLDSIRNSCDVLMCCHDFATDISCVSGARCYHTEGFKFLGLWPLPGVGYPPPFTFAKNHPLWKDFGSLSLYLSKLFIWNLKLHNWATWPQNRIIILLLKWCYAIIGGPLSQYHECCPHTPPPTRTPMQGTIILSADMPWFLSDPGVPGVRSMGPVVSK